jgi:acyl carrier protein
MDYAKSLSPGGGPSTDTTAQLLALVSELVRESSPQRTVAIALDDSLERDLAIDSLARVELMLRLEKRFGVRLPESVMADAESVRDLLGALSVAEPVAPIRAQAPAVVAAVPPLEPLDGAALADAPTLVAVLLTHVSHHPDRPHIVFYEDGERTRTWTYRELYEAAKGSAAGLRALGIGAGDTVAIMLPTCLEFFSTFYGVLFAGAVPVPMYPPARPSQLEDHLLRQAEILASCRACALVTVREVRPLARLIQPKVESLRHVLTPGELAQSVPVGIARPRGTDLALLQYTSGSTGNPKGVMLTHAQLLANIRAWTERVALSPADVCVSWLPLYHDMGLIGTWLGSLYNACLLVLMSPLTFLARPQRWLWAIHRHRGTITAAPNFAFELLLRHYDAASFAGLDLSSWRMCCNGAEPVSPDTIERFASCFAAHGFSARAMAPVYGLAECAVGLAVPPPGRGPRIDRVARAPFVNEGRAVPAVRDDPQPLRFAVCGPPLPRHELRVVDEQGRALGERRVGRIEFRGPSATAGYYRNPQASAALFHNGWLDTGDLGYLVDGEVVPTSRVKDMIIRGGHNLYPYELEEAIGALPGIRRGCVAIFGSRDPMTASERLVVVAETRLADGAARSALVHTINERALALLGTPVDTIVLAPPHSVLKTSSGKIRRPATREAYESGRLGRAALPAWLQVTKMAIVGAVGRIGGAVHRGARLLYGVYALTWAALLTPPLLLALAVAPPGAASWAVCRRLIRLLLAVARVRVECRGLDRIPGSGPLVLASNHASYLDGPILLAVLPRPVVFVAKRELLSAFLVRFVLDRLRVRYVERFEQRASVADAQRLAQDARAGEPLFYFAEGTFHREPGLLPFHLGAFAAAAAAGAPVVPIALCGTRTLLPADHWLPRSATVTVTAGAPLMPAGEDWDAAIALRDAARRFIAAHCGEPERTDVR